MKNKNLIIRSSSAEFLIFERQTHASGGIEVRFEEGDLWLTQKALGELYDCSTDNIGLHLKNIYKDLELDINSTTETFSVVQKEGNREVKRNIKYYNLDAIISVGYRVNSDRAIQFRRWATSILKEFSKKGYIIDNFYDEENKCFVRNKQDKKMDISILGLVTPFNVFSPNEKKITNTIERINMHLRTYTRWLFKI